MNLTETRYGRIFSPVGPHTWLTILVVQALLALTVIVFPSLVTLLVACGVFVLVPALYAWPTLAFTIILFTVPSYATLFEIGKLSVRPNDLAVLVGVVAVILQWIREKRIKIEISSLDIPLLLVMLWILLSLFWTANFGMGVFHVVKIFGGILIYLIVINLINDKKRLRKALLIWVVVAIYWSAVGVYALYFESIPAAERHTIIAGTLPHLGKTVRTSIFFESPNDFAFVLSITIMMAIAFVTLSGSRTAKWLGGGNVIMMVIIMIGTFSRKSWLGLALSIFLLGLKRRRIMLMSILLVLLSVAFIMWTGRGSFSAALINRIESFFLEPGISITERAMAWRIAKGLFINRPVLGNGVGSFFVLGPAMGSPLNIPHNFYWLILCELGLVGMLLFAVYVGNVCYSLARVLRKPMDREEWMLSLVFLTTIPSVLFQSAFKTIGFTEPIFLVFFAFISWICRHYRCSGYDSTFARQFDG
jgi:O-antigen ligase